MRNTSFCWAFKKTVKFATNPIKRFKEDRLYLDFGPYQRFNNCCLLGDKRKCVVQVRTYTGKKKKVQSATVLLKM